MSDEHQIGYQALPRGVPVHASDGTKVGTVHRVLDNAREHIFDGIVLDTPQGRRFVDAPEVARITNRRVTLTIDAAAAGELTDYAPGAPEYRADVRGGRLSRFFGGGWKRD
jgi:hypothetical protein